MTFLAPALLALGLAVAVPLILHLMQRQHGPRIVFPAVRYLLRAEREHATRIRLRQVLLLVLRVLAVLLLAAAAARPFLPIGGSGHPPTSVVLILDNSLSTSAVVGEQRVLDELQAVALRTVEAAGAEDRLWLLRTGQPWEPAVTGSRGTIAAAIRETRPSAGGGDLGAELQRAESILASESGDDRPREIHLISDLQATSHALSGEADIRFPLLVYRPSGEPPVNWSVRALEVGGGLPPRAGERTSVAATVAGGDGDPTAGGRDSVALRLVVDGAVRAAGVAPAGAAAVLPLSPRQPGMVTGRVELDADALTADDQRHFVLQILPPPTVALATPAPFLEEALGVLEEGGRIRLAAVGAADVVVAPGAEGASAVRTGADVVVLPPASPLERGAANQRLSTAGLPFRYGTPAPGAARLTPVEPGLEEVLADARVQAPYPLELTGTPGSVLIRLSDGEPWAIAGGVQGGGRFVALGSPLTPEGGTIATSAAMVPLLDRSITAWTLDAATARTHEPGDVASLPAHDSVVSPQGTATTSGSVLRLTETGVYRVLRDEQVVAAYAVNPPPAESDLRRLSEDGLRAALNGTDVRLAGPDQWGDRIFHRRLGREITTPLLLALLALLLAEAIVAAPGRSGTTRGARPGEATTQPVTGSPSR